MTGTVRERQDTMKKYLILPGTLGALYVYMILPRLVGRPDRAPFKQKLFAHRGLYDNASEAPENSMAAFRKAVEADFGIELDVQLSKDGVPVIMHDEDLRRACGVDRPVKSLTLEELKKLRLFQSEETVPTLREFLDMVHGRVPLIVEIKADNTTDVSLCGPIQALLDEYQGLYCVESFNPLVLLWYRTHRKSVMRGQLSEAFSRTKKFESLFHKPFLLQIQFLTSNLLTRPDFIAYNCLHEKNLSRRILRRVFRTPQAAWTIKSRQQLASQRDRFDVFIFDSFVPDRPNL